MPHEITQVDGESSFIFNEDRGWPWHRLGTPMAGFQTVGAALEAAKCNDIVTLDRLWKDEAGEPYGPELYEVVSDIYGPMGVAGGGYKVMQCGEIMDIAARIVGMTEDEAVIDTMGRLGEFGERFFCHVEFPELVIDPEGIADTIRRGLFVGTSFDGSMANTIGLSNIREVCANTVRMSLGQLRQAISVKHTGNAEERMDQAAMAVGYAAAAERAMVEKAQAMLSVDGGRAFVAATQALWPIPDDLPKQHATRRAGVHEEVARLYLDGPTNFQLVGHNGWAVYGAITEWLDWMRPMKGLEGDAATFRRLDQTLLDVSNPVNDKKMTAAAAILALV